MNTPVRLHKKTDDDFEVKLNSYAYIIVPILLVILMILIVAVFAVLLGHVSATESGVYFNHLKDVV